jgi:hypothetical protein
MIVDIVDTMIVDIMMVDIVGTMMVAVGMTTTIMIITTIIIIMVMISMLGWTIPYLARPSRAGAGQEANRSAGRPADLSRPGRRPRPDGLTLRLARQVVPPTLLSVLYSQLLNSMRNYDCA